MSSKFWLNWMQAAWTPLKLSIEFQSAILDLPRKHVYFSSKGGFHFTYIYPAQLL